MRHPTSNEIQKRVIARDLSSLDVRDRLQKLGARKHRRETSGALGRNPVNASVTPGARRPSISYQFTEEIFPAIVVLPIAILPSRTLRQRHQRVQHVVQLIRVARLAPPCVAPLLN